MPKGKSQVRNVISSYTEIKMMIAKQAAHTMEQFVNQQIVTLVADSLEDTMLRAYKVRTGTCLVVYSVVEQIISDLLRA